MGAVRSVLPWVLLISAGVIVGLVLATVAFFAAGVVSGLADVWGSRGDS